MVKKIYLLAVGLLLLILLIGSPLLKIADTAGILEIKDLGNSTGEGKVYSGTPADEFLNGISLLKDALSDLYTNFMPGYYETVTVWNELEDGLNEPFSSLYSRARSKITADEGTTVTIEKTESDHTESETEEPLPPDPEKVTSVQSVYLSESSTHRYYQVDIAFADGKEVSFLDTAVNLSDEEKAARVKIQAKKLNRIAESNDEVNFYFMLLTRMQDTDYYEDIIVGEESTGEYADLFLSLLNEKIISEKWDIGSVRDRTERVYLTDHHWTTYGSYLGYRQICGMICPDFTPVELGEPIDFPKSRFYGSNARISQTLSLWDVFRVYDYDMGPYICNPSWYFENQVDFLAEQTYLSPDYNIYAIFYPEIYAVKYPENNTGRNLLVIGDSYTQGFAQLLGSAFDTTVIYYYTMYNGMNYNSVIEQYGITDVLFMQFSDRILFDLYGDDVLSSIKVD